MTGVFVILLPAMPLLLCIATMLRMSLATATQKVSKAITCSSGGIKVTQLRLCSECRAFATLQTLALAFQIPKHVNYCVPSVTYALCMVYTGHALLSYAEPTALSVKVEHRGAKVKCSCMHCLRAAAIDLNGNLQPLTEQ